MDRKSQGEYTISFEAPFAEPPIVVAVANSYGKCYALSSAETAQSVPLAPRLPCCQNSLTSPESPHPTPLHPTPPTLSPLHPRPPGDAHLHDRPHIVLSSEDRHGVQLLCGSRADASRAFLARGRRGSVPVPSRADPLVTRVRTLSLVDFRAAPMFSPL